MKNSIVSFTNKSTLEEAIVTDTQEVPELGEHDLLVEVLATALNPIDLKLRQKLTDGQSKILGFDAVGKVVAIGSEVSPDMIDQLVYYMGTTQRAGSFQRYQLVDERLAAKAPRSLSAAESAALPLTSLTAWELFFERFGLNPEEAANTGKTILIINGAGGVGSIASQLASWSGLKVYATSSPENFDWLQRNGAVHCLDYHQPLKDQLPDGLKFDFIACFYDITFYIDQLAELIKPLGHIGTIVNTKEALDLNPLKNLSVSFDWEYAFAKTDFYDDETQGNILGRIAELIDAGELQTTLARNFSDGISKENLLAGLKLVDEGHFGKIVLSGGFHE